MYSTLKIPYFVNEQTEVFVSGRWDWCIIDLNCICPDDEA